MFKITIDNEEVLCDKDITINEEMLNTSSVILNNVYPKTWEEDKDYVSRFYYPKDYSKCKIFEETYYPEEEGTTEEGTSLSIDYDTDRNYEYSFKGQTSQSGTPTPSSPQPINITTGRQEVFTAQKNLADVSKTLIGYAWNWGTNSARAVLYIPAKENTSYTFSFSGTNTMTSMGIFFKTNKSDTSVLGGNIYDFTGTRTLTSPTNTNWIGIQFNKTAITIDDITPLKLMVSTSSDTTYEEYKGNDYEINLGKNLLPNERATTTESGITITKNSDGTYNVNGTATADISLAINLNTFIPMRGTWRMTGCPSGGSNTTYMLSAYVGYWGGGSPNIDTGNGTNITYTGNVKVRFYIKSGTHCDNLTFKPMITYDLTQTYNDFAPYKTPIYLGKIGTYQDYIFRNTTENPLYDSNLEEGQWYIHKEIGRVVLNGSENWTTRNGGTSYAYMLQDVFDKYRTTGLCNYFRFIEGGASGSQTTECIASANTNGTASIFTNNSSLNTLANFKTWLGTHNLEVYYVLNTPTTILIEDEELINQLNSIELLNGLNNINVSSPYLPIILRLHYNFREAYTTQDLYFCGIVKNTGNISLNPRYPHYCSVEVLDFKDFLSQGETLDFVINNKTIEEAIEQVINTIAPYGFIKGNVQISNSLSIINAYSTKDKTAYDVFNYIADITQSRWKTRMLDENTIAIDFYDPNLLPEGETIEYNQTWFENNLIDDISYSYTSNDYRNRQIMISNEVYGNISQVETKTSDGYLSQYNTEQKIGKVNSISVNGTEKTIATDTERQLGETADFYYTVGNNYFESDINLNPGDIISINYIPIVQGRQIINNIGEISRIESMTGRKGIIARYENRNDATTSTELQLIGQSYIKYKGVSEIKLIVATRKNIWNIGDRVQFNAPLQELTTEYMVKRKVTKRIKTIDTMFYEFELSSSFNMEQDINFFDNQRAKAKGNIADGEYISRNVDIENSGNIIFYGFSAEGVLINTDNTLNCVLNAPLVK